MSFDDLGIIEGLRFSSLGGIGLESGSDEEHWKDNREMPLASREAMAEAPNYCQ